MERNVTDVSAVVATGEIVNIGEILTLKTTKTYNVVRIGWVFSSQLKLPWRPVLAAAGTTTHYLGTTPTPNSVLLLPLPLLWHWHHPTPNLPLSLHYYSKLSGAKSQQLTYRPFSYLTDPVLPPSSFPNLLIIITSSRRSDHAIGRTIRRAMEKRTLGRGQTPLRPQSKLIEAQSNLTGGRIDLTGGDGDCIAIIIWPALLNTWLAVRWSYLL